MGTNQKTNMGKTMGSMRGTKTKFDEAINEEIDPPHCVNVRMVGHSFAPGS